MSECRSCHDPIVWAKFIPKGSKAKNGKNVPLNADENGQPLEYPDDGKAGRVQLDHVEQNFLEGTELMIVRALGDGEEIDPEVPVWLTHFVTCPQAHQWRDRNKREKLAS